MRGLLARRVVAATLVATLLSAALASSHHDHDERDAASAGSERCADVHLHAVELAEHDACLACLARVAGVTHAPDAGQRAPSVASLRLPSPADEPVATRQWRPDAPRGPPSEPAA